MRKESLHPKQTKAVLSANPDLEAAYESLVSDLARELSDGEMARAALALTTHELNGLRHLQRMEEKAERHCAHLEGKLGRQAMEIRTMQCSLEEKNEGFDFMYTAFYKARRRWRFVPVDMIRNFLIRLDFLLQDVAYKIITDRMSGAPRPRDPARSEAGQ